MSGAGLGGEDPAVLHDDLRIQRPPGARTLLRQHMHSDYESLKRRLNEDVTITEKAPTKAFSVITNLHVNLRLKL